MGPGNCAAGQFLGGDDDGGVVGANALYDRMDAFLNDEFGAVDKRNNGVGSLLNLFYSGRVQCELMSIQSRNDYHLWAFLGPIFYP